MTYYQIMAFLLMRASSGVPDTIYYSYRDLEQFDLRDLSNQPIRDLETER